MLEQCSDRAEQRKSVSEQCSDRAESVSEQRESRAVQRVCQSSAEKKCVRAVQTRAEQSGVEQRESVSEQCSAVQCRAKRSRAEQRVCQSRAESICVCVRAKSVSVQRQSSAEKSRECVRV